MKIGMKVDVAIIGAGTAGLYALREVRRAKKSFVLIDHGPLGTTCARVGCMPSKVVLHEAQVWSSRGELAAIGVSGADAMQIDTRQAWSAMRQMRDSFVSGTAEKARQAAGSSLMNGRVRFLEPTVLEVESETGRTLVEAKAVIIATGSKPVIPQWLDGVKDRVVTTDDLFEMPDLPRSMGILGLGAIGMEMGLALSRLGVKLVGADVSATIAGIGDPVVNVRAIARFGQEMTLWLGAPASVSAAGDGVILRSGEREAKVDRLLVAMGRAPNLAALNLREAGISVDARGLPVFDSATLQIGALPVYIAGDANGRRPLMHEAADDGVIAGYNAVRSQPQRFRRKVALGIAFTDPDVASIGARLDQLDPNRIVIGEAEGSAVGRARIIGATESLIRLYADAQDGKLLGASLMAGSGEHLAHLLAWSIQRGETAESLLQMPFYHPVMEELLPVALQAITQKVTSNRKLPAGFVFED